MRFTLLFLLLFALAACDSNSGGGGGTSIDYPARFSEDTQGGDSIPGGPNDLAEGLLIYSNPQIGDLLNQLSSGEILNKNFGKREKAQRELRSKGVPLPYEPATGTYEYDAEAIEGPWLHVDENQPNDSALFFFGPEDGLTATIDGQEGVAIAVQLQYWVEVVTYNESEIEWNTTVEVSYEPYLPAKQMVMIYREHVNLHGMGDQNGFEIRMDVGDPAAAEPVASGAATWLGPVLLHLALWESGTETATTYEGIFGTSFAIYNSESDFLLREGEQVSTTETFPIKGGSVAELYLRWLHFGYTSNPQQATWALEATLDPSQEPGVYAGQVLYRGRQVATLAGDDTQVSCETCDPPKDCENIWLTWNRDPENPVLVCEALGILD